MAISTSPDVDRKAAAFASIWSKALEEYQKQTKIDLGSSDVPHLNSVDDLVSYVDSQGDEYGEDTKSSKFTQVVKGAVGPFNFLMSTVGSTAAPMFPGGSQVLAAVSVLVNAGKGVSGAFEAVGGLFNKLGSFTARLKEVSHEEIPDALIPIYQGMLVSLLKICALATNITFREMKKVPDEEKRHSLKTHMKKLFRPVAANVTAYLKSLLMGGDADIATAVGELKRLVEDESAMMEAVLVRKTTKVEDETMKIKSLAVKIQGFTIEMSEVMYDLQTTTTGIKVTVNEILGKIDISAAESKAAHEEEMAALQIMHSNLKELLERDKKRDVTAKQDPSSKTAQLTQSKTSKKHDQLALLKSQLAVTKVDKANAAALNIITPIDDTTNWILREEPVQQWMDGNLATLVLSGDPGVGKTHLAGRIVKELQNKYKPGVTGAPHKSVAYFFCRKDNLELENVDYVIRNLTYLAASTDRLFAKHVADLFATSKLRMYDGSLHADVDVDESQSARREEPDGQPVGVPETNDVTTESRTSEPSSPAAPAETVEADNDLEKATEEQPVALPDEDVQDSRAARIAKYAQVLQVVKGLGKLDDGREQESVKSIADLWKVLFSDYFRKTANSSASFVIDALDDCSEIETMALWAAVRELNSDENNTPPKLQVMVVVRPDMADVFLNDQQSDDITASHVLIDANKNSQDLENFVKHRLAVEWSSRLVNQALFDECERRIVQRSEGSFLKASLIIDEITSLSRESAIRDKLQTLPPTLEAATLLVISRLERQLDENEVRDLHDILAWVACAHRQLSLAELDALLTTRHPLGDRVIDLETRLREHFGTLFAVNDVFSIEDKDAEQRLRERIPEDILGEVMSVRAGTKNTKAVKCHDTDFSEAALERSVQRMKRIYVDLGHTLIKEQIQQRTAQEGISAFSTNSMQAMVLLKCLDSICVTPSSFTAETVELARGYSGSYLADHILDVKIDEVDVEGQAQIVTKLVQLLRTDENTDRWVRAAEYYLANDLLATKAVREKIGSWFSTAAVQHQFDEDTKDWMGKAAQAPLTTMLEGIAKSCARRWLANVTEFSSVLGFLVNYLKMSESEAKGEDLGYEYADPTKDEIIRAADWANLEQNALWMGRVASALRSAEQFDDALTYGHKAAELDTENFAFPAGLAYIHEEKLQASGDKVEKEQWEDAILHMNDAITRIKRAIERGDDSPNPDWSLKQFLNNYYVALSGYYDSSEKFDLSLQTWESALEDWEEEIASGDDYWAALVNSATSYFIGLYRAKDWTRAMELIKRINAHPRAESEAFLQVYSYFLDRGAEVKEVALRSGQKQPVDQLLSCALFSVAKYGPDGQTAMALHTRAAFLFRFDPEKTATAVALAQAASADEEIADISSDYVWVRDLAEKELARYYISQALTAREKDLWPEVGSNADQLVRLVHDMKDGDGNVVYGQRDCAHILAAWHTVNNRPKRARKCVEVAVKLGINMLSDTDPGNDVTAWYYLEDAMLVLGDADRAVAATNAVRRGLAPRDDDNQTAAGEEGEGEEKSEETGSGDNEAADVNGDEDEDGKKNSSDAPEPAELNHPATADATIVSEDQQTRQQEVNGITDHAVPSATQDDKSEDPQESNDDSTAAAPTIKPVPGAFFTCDGSCFNEIPNSDAFYRCRFCIADFCENCHALIKNGTMKDFYICGASHDHVRIEGAEWCAQPDTIRLRGEETPIVEWVAELKREFGL